jgi:hypothetical protein
MKVIRTYSDGYGYGVFLLEDGSEKRFPLYWMFSPWSDAEENQEVQDLLGQTTSQTAQCANPNCQSEWVQLFPPPNRLCYKCEINAQIDADYFWAIDLINRIK